MTENKKPLIILTTYYIDRSNGCGKNKRLNWTGKIAWL